MAKELGLKPRILIKNIPSKNQQWKAPVKYWIRDLYEKRIFGKAAVANPIVEGTSSGNRQSPRSRKQHSQQGVPKSFEEERWGRILVKPPEWIADDYLDEDEYCG